VRVQEESHSPPRRAVEATEPHADGSVEGQEPSVPCLPLGLVRTPDKPAMPSRILDNNIVEQVVDKIYIVVEGVDKVRFFLHP
jgi:hypothetical protein